MKIGSRLAARYRSLSLTIRSTRGLVSSRSTGDNTRWKNARCSSLAGGGGASVGGWRDSRSLKVSITRYRDNTGVRNNQLMSIATASLKNDDITAIANYLTQLP